MKIAFNVLTKQISITVGNPSGAAVQRSVSPSPARSLSGSRSLISKKYDETFQKALQVICGEISSFINVYRPASARRPLVPKPNLPQYQLLKTALNF